MVRCCTKTLKNTAVPTIFPHKPENLKAPNERISDPNKKPSLEKENGECLTALRKRIEDLELEVLKLKRVNLNLKIKLKKDPKRNISKN